MKKLYIGLGLIAMSLSTSVLADGRINTDTGEWQDCGPAKVDAVRVERGAIFALLTNNKDHWKSWKRIALNNTSFPYMKEVIPNSGLLANYSSSNDLKKVSEMEENLRFKTEMQSSQFQSVLENALLNDKTVTIRFPGTESCKVDNWGSNAVMVQLNK
ncbi:hypothetical protein C0Z01_12485 [Photobacterium kishitanii]|uniref:hypothetical protein n=1 Tax=Photobacterium kishitanii TaxID=318456 RepID=UPI00071AED6E|nr:hypothetical protein [Photobacterium kishitanii]OBU23849.1 hypothetical protein AYY22_05790 [Photobacterium kishitanii]PSV10123.1 hypothetical protein C0W28_19805 [Photobacterium kishitanii]PSW68993.1 hypothetical protein C0Z01_12485 [Photobacterium kishitanii]